MLPFILLVVFGSIQYGLYFWASQGGSDAARKAARLGAVGDYPSCAAFRSSVRSAIAPLGDESGATITRTYESDGGSKRVAADGSDVLIGDYVSVKVKFDSYDFHFPLLPFVNHGQVSSDAKARVENLNDGKPISCS